MLITQACDLRQFSPAQMALDLATGGAEDLNAGKAAFDRVLVDAPCSGTGVLAKRADLRWQRLPEDIAQMARLQVSQRLSKFPFLNCVMINYMSVSLQAAWWNLFTMSRISAT